MALVNLKCPNCGANITLDNENKTAVCEFCGSTFAIPNEEDTDRRSTKKELEEKITFLIHEATENEGYKNESVMMDIEDEIRTYTEEYPQSEFGYQNYITWMIKILPYVNISAIPDINESIGEMLGHYKHVKDAKYYEEIQKESEEALKKANARYDEAPDEEKIKKELDNETEKKIDALKMEEEKCAEERDKTLAKMTAIYGKNLSFNRYGNFVAPAVIIFIACAIFGPFMYYYNIGSSLLQAIFYIVLISDILLMIGIIVLRIIYQNLNQKLKWILKKDNEYIGKITSLLKESIISDEE